MAVNKNLQDPSKSIELHIIDWLYIFEIIQTMGVMFCRTCACVLKHSISIMQSFSEDDGPRNKTGEARNICGAKYG